MNKTNVFLRDLNLRTNHANFKKDLFVIQIIILKIIKVQNYTIV